MKNVTIGGALKVAEPGSKNAAEFAGSSDLYSRDAKRVIDLVLLLMLAPLYLPIVGLLWFLVRLDGGPGFYAHPRVGRDGRRFLCLKIRTMVPDAETALFRYLAANPDRRAEWETNFKLERDPRVTRIGWLLRKTSLDELPQVLNVLRGEMSFVGPRPVTEAELAFYGEHLDEAYLALRPGLTGAWQVGGRNDVSYGTRVGLDLAYARNMSALGDLRLIALTILHVALCKGR